MRKQRLFFILLKKPFYWPFACGLGLLFLLTKFPHRWQLATGRLLGNLMYHVIKKRRKIAEINIARCFPHLSLKAQQKLVKKNFQSTGIAVCETAMAWWLSEKKLSKLLKIQGEAHLFGVLKQGKGVLLLGAHFTTIDIIGRLASLNYPITAIYKHQNNIVIDEILKRYRHKGMLTLIDNRKMRDIVKALQSNQIVWYAYDQDFGPKRCVFAPFFGIQTATLKAPMRLAELSGAPVMTCAHYRREDGSYDLIFHPPLNNFPSNNLEKDAAQINQIFENVIREKPEQYLWLHRRFKTRPQGEVNFYKN